MPVYLQPRNSILVKIHAFLLKIMSEVGRNDFKIASNVVVSVPFMLYFALAVAFEV